MLKQIPIFYATDDNYIRGCLVSLTSMMVNASKDYNYRVHILSTSGGISDKNKEYFYDLQAKTPNLTVTFDDVSSLLVGINQKLAMRDFYTSTTYYRLFIAEMYPEYDKVIYIDSDTVVLGDISEMYNTNIEKYYVGAAREQVMLQVDVYGTYVEQVCGISREVFFNAGVLLINCKAFRDEKIFDKFCNLLDEYKFVVTQDEDYLNVLCEDRTYLLDSAWNVEVFGVLPCKEEDIKIIHYIMVSKPWHYENARLEKYFWKYADMTPVAEDLREELRNYTDDKKAEDKASEDRLLQTAIRETAREDTYYKVKKNSRKTA